MPPSNKSMLRASSHAATRSAVMPPMRPPMAAPALMRPMSRRAVCGSKRSFTTDQKPLMRSEPKVATWR
jgi:hypothetical protein